MSDTPRMHAIPRNGAFHHYLIEDVFAVGEQLERDLAAMTRDRDRWMHAAAHDPGDCPAKGICDLCRGKKAMEERHQLVSDLARICGERDEAMRQIEKMKETWGDA